MKTTRRHFLASSASLAAGCWMAPRFAIGRSGPSANSRINLACIGVGGRIAYDAAGMKITNRPELNAHLQVPAREGWRYGESL